MLQSLRFGLGVGLLAAAQIASAGTAQISVTNFDLTATNGDWWFWTPKDVDWVAPSAGASAALTAPAFADSSTIWHGRATSASVMDGSSSASAALTAALSESDNLKNVSASAQVTANGGQAGWAFAKVFDGQVLVSKGATLTLSAIVSNISAVGDGSQANAYLEICTTNFVTDTCDPAQFAEAFVDGASGPYAGPTLLAVSWTNTATESMWVKMHTGLTASAMSAAPVPEPTSLAMLTAGLLGLGALRRRRG